MLGLPAYWHTMQAVLTSILKVHYESLDEGGKAVFSRATVLHDANFLQRRGISPVKFHLVEPLVIDGWNARIGAILYQLLQRDGRGLPVESRPSFQTTCLDKSAEQTTMDAVDDMLVSLTTRRVCRGDSPTCLHARFLERTRFAEELSSRQGVCKHVPISAKWGDIPDIAA